MKKFICILMIFCCIGGLCACSISQPTTNNNLEERVAYLEKLLGVETQTNLQQENTPSPTEKEEVTSVYSLSEMTPEEIVETIKYYIDNRPKDGDTIENIKNRILVEPASFESSYSIIADFPRAFGRHITKDCIAQIYYGNCYLEIDGNTLGGLKDQGYIHIELEIADYDRAEKLFDELVSYFDSVCEKEFPVNKEGSSWKFGFGTLYNNYIIHEIDGNETNSYIVNDIIGLSVEINRVNDGYVFYISMYICNS